ncbi:cell division protein FtsQ/DivIB [Clostridium peptidivorans]|uniref:cell division protein FtsQ/DivIB n=1 Tax=Clostridium peptidivorans TaxID=100174 RepID=UPI000BE40410|nr:FtsQ-type POTRA domain-containing protein [Clostridium peptidivorans]
MIEVTNVNSKDKVVEDNNKEKNEFILKRRRRKFVKKLVLSLLFLIGVLMTLLLKHPYFNIKDIKVNNNKNISISSVIETSKLSKGNNIFYIDLDSAKKNLLKDPYILDAEMKRELPSTLVVTVKEREAVFYGNNGNRYLVLDKNGVVLEERQDIKNMNLVKLQGFDENKSKVGQPIVVDDERKIETARELSALLGSKKDNYGISTVDIHDITNIKVYYNNICIKLGNNERLEEKLNKAFNIAFQKEELKGKKGYIDVSFEGNPVVFIE